jgi:hypothetical protein
MFSEDELKKLYARQNVVEAWEKKYGEPVPRVIANFLMTAPPDAIVARFRDNPGPHIPPQEVGGVDTALMGGEWEQTVGWDSSPELSGDPKSLAERMVPVYVAAFERVRKRKPTPAELECVMAVGRSETMWGTAKFPGGLGPGMHNHGAVQCHQGCTDENSFQSSDTHPLDSGGSVRYEQRFRRYASDEDGAAGLIRSVGNDPLRMLSSSGDLLAAFSLGMFGNRYYEMFNASPATVNANRATYDWIREHATRPPPKTSDSFRSAMARAKDPIWAGRVLMHTIGLNKSIEATCKTLGTKRHTRFVPPLLGGREAIGLGVGSLVGLAAGGPVGAGLGALLGFAAGRVSR